MGNEVASKRFSSTLDYTSEPISIASSRALALFSRSEDLAHNKSQALVSVVGYYEALHPLVEWIQLETGEPRDCHGPQLFRVQFHQDSPYTRTSPAMAAGVLDRLWSVEDSMALSEAYELRRAERAA